MTIFLTECESAAAAPYHQVPEAPRPEETTSEPSPPGHPVYAPSQLWKGFLQRLAQRKTDSAQPAPTLRDFPFPPPISGAADPPLAYEMEVSVPQPISRQTWHLVARRRRESHAADAPLRDADPIRF